MLALEVLREQLGLDRPELGRELQRHQRHMRDALHRHRRLDRLGDRRSPSRTDRAG